MTYDIAFAMARKRRMKGLIGVKAILEAYYG
jgi:hypothetical protein